MPAGGRFAVDSLPSPATIDPMPRESSAHKWDQMSDKDLEYAARYYYWLAEVFPDFRSQRLDEVVAEVERRGKPEILRHAKASVSR